MEQSTASGHEFFQHSTRSSKQAQNSGFSSLDKMRSTGSKRNARECLPPLPPSSVSSKRPARQRSESCLSTVSEASGSVTGSAAVGSHGGGSTPTSASTFDAPPQNAAEVQRSCEGLGHPASAQLLTDFSGAHCKEASPSITDITFDSAECRGRVTTGAVKCEEQLDGDDDETHGCAHSSTAHECPSLLESSPHWESNAHIPAPTSGSCAPIYTPDAEVAQHPQAQAVSSTDGLDQCGIYEEDILRNLKEKESDRLASWGYLGTKQCDLVAEHRKIMVNWLVEFAEEFDLQPDTLFLCVTILDQFLLHGPPVKKESLQLLGTACMLVSVKFQESQPPNMIYSCCVAAEGSFRHEHVLQMEALVLKTIKYRCSVPTVYSFMWHHLKKLSPDLKLEKLSEYLSSLSLLDYDLLKFNPSLVSAASVLLACVIEGRNVEVSLSQMRTDYTIGNLKPAMKILAGLLLSTTSSCPNAIKAKFLHQRQLAVAATPSQIPVALLS